MLKKSLLTTPVGQLLAVADENLLYHLEFTDCLNDKKSKYFQSMIEARTGVIDLLEQELGHYFKGFLTKFTIPLHIQGSEFQQTVWGHLKQIPHGQTRSYKEIAHALSKPSHFRAVARANSTNRFPIIIPCHRVINANGNLGGYAGGISRKEWLLNHEQVSK